MSAASESFLVSYLRESAVDEGGLRALARVIGISPQTLYDVLAGRPPGRHVRRALAAYLEIPAELVTEWANDVTP